MKRRLLPFLCAILLVAGCATPPPAGGPEEEPPEEPVAAEPAEEPAPPAAEAPKPEPKPWEVKLEHGRALARVDGVQVYLGKPAQTDWKTKRTNASWLDRKSTLGPLLHSRETPLATARPMRICIDPGHGGSDPGAASPDRRTRESDLALDVARRVRALLAADGFDVMMTRYDAVADQTLEERAAKARRWRADAFVSVHFNTNPGSAASRGLETYVFPARGMESTSYDGRKASPESAIAWLGNAHDGGNVQLGFCIQRRLLAATRLPDRGLRRARFVVLREASVPAALVECGFLSSPQDLAYARSEAGRDALARGIYEGICDFAFGTMRPGLPARSPGGPAEKDPEALAAPPDAPPPVEFVQGAGYREAPYAPPVPADAADPARRDAREAALRAAGVVPANGEKKEKP